MLEKRNEEIDFFVLYSSITSVLGNSGQTTYSAANAFMNSFADYRKKVLGKPCLAVCWGAMGGAGILERNNKVAMLLEKSGLHLLDIPNGRFLFPLKFATLNVAYINIQIFRTVTSLKLLSSKLYL